MATPFFTLNLNEDLAALTDPERCLAGSYDQEVGGGSVVAKAILSTTIVYPRGGFYASNEF